MIGAIAAHYVSPAAGVSDDFNRANSTTSLGSTSTGGVVWTALVGTWGIASNAAYLATKVADTSNLAIVDTGLVNGTVKVTLANCAEFCGLRLRSVDASNGYTLEVRAGVATTTFYRRAAGAYTSLGSAPAAAPWANGDILEVVMAGNAFTVKRNGATVLTVNDSTYPTQTKHGLHLHGGTESAPNRFDDFSVTP